jgi:hypothetical protein
VHIREGCKDTTTKAIVRKEAQDFPRDENDDDMDRDRLKVEEWLARHVRTLLPWCLDTHTDTRGPYERESLRDGYRDVVQQLHDGRVVHGGNVPASFRHVQNLPGGLREGGELRRGRLRLMSLPAHFCYMLVANTAVRSFPPIMSVPVLCVCMCVCVCVSVHVCVCVCVKLKFLR